MVAQKLGKTIRELEDLMTLEELFEWQEWIRLENRYNEIAHERAQRKAKRGKGKKR